MPARCSHGEHHVRFIYCLTDGQTLKVGSSLDPDARLIALRRETGRDLRLVQTWTIGRVKAKTALILERHVHDSLGRRLGSRAEWYSIPLNEALLIITAAVKYLLGVWKRRPTQREARFTAASVNRSHAMSARTL